jgi:hypothetical protein
VKSLKKILISPLFYFVFLVLLLDFAALDDITTGNQPSNWVEWDFLIASVFVFGLITYSKLVKSNK